LGIFEGEVPEAEPFSLEYDHGLSSSHGRVRDHPPPHPGANPPEIAPESSRSATISTGSYGRLQRIRRRTRSIRSRTRWNPARFPSGSGPISGGNRSRTHWKSADFEWKSLC